MSNFANLELESVIQMRNMFRAGELPWLAAVLSSLTYVLEFKPILARPTASVVTHILQLAEPPARISSNLDPTHNAPSFLPRG